MKSNEKKIKALEEMNPEELLSAAIAMAKTNADQEVLIEELNASLEAASLSAESKCLVVSFKKDKYKVLAQSWTKTDGSLILASDLPSHEEELERLIQIGSGILEKISETETKN